MIYLDYQATTPLAPEALDAMLPWLRDQHANPHSAHRPGRAAKAAVEVARDEIAKLLPPGGRVVFTGGATEALNWAIKGSTGPIKTWATEHAAVLDTVAAADRAGRPVAVLPVDGEGVATVTPALSRGSASVPRSETAGHRVEPVAAQGGLWTAMLVNNEIGAINPVASLADAAHAAGALFLCDAVQGYGRVPIPASVDLVAVSAHKIHGPKGIGALWIRDGVQLEPLLHGGDQEIGRSGTLSPALCAGFGAAARLMREGAAEDAAHVDELWRSAAERLAFPAHPPACGRGLGGGHSVGNGPYRSEQRDSPPRCSGEPCPRHGSGMPGEHSAPNAPLVPAGEGDWHLNGPATPRYHGNLNIRLPGLDIARLMSDLRDIAFSAGSACASGSGRASHVLRAIGLTDAEARSSIRLGWGRYTTQVELTDALDRIDTAARAQQASP